MRRLRALALLLALCLLSACAAPAPAAPAGAAEVTGHMDLAYAEMFTVDYYADGTSLLTIAGTEKYLILPEGMTERPAHDADAAALPAARRIYLAASSAMDLVEQIGAMDAVAFTGTRREDWSLPAVRAAMDEGSLVYAGKYSAPDFELLSGRADLAVESTMIYHSPDIQEKLEQLGIPVLVERSSYESHPLGRLEWVKVYGLLTGHLAEAEAFFQRQLALLDDLEDIESTGRTVAFFYINSAGAAVVRKSGDYVSRMIDLAGGAYVFSDLGDGESALSTVNMQMESFFVGAKDADVLIYNSTIDAAPASLEELLSRSELLRQFRAVQTGEVWCTGQNLFQQSSATAQVIREMHAIFAGDGAADLQFFHKLT
jgi:iron complex transport system substrate-binding protein